MLFECDASSLRAGKQEDFSKSRAWCKHTQGRKSARFCLSWRAPRGLCPSVFGAAISGPHVRLRADANLPVLLTFLQVLWVETDTISTCSIGFQDRFDLVPAEVSSVESTALTEPSHPAPLLQSDARLRTWPKDSVRVQAISSAGLV